MFTKIFPVPNKHTQARGAQRLPARRWLHPARRWLHPARRWCTTESAALASLSLTLFVGGWVTPPSSAAMLVLPRNLVAGRALSPMKNEHVLSTSTLPAVIAPRNWSQRTSFLDLTCSVPLAAARRRWLLLGAAGSCSAPPAAARRRWLLLSAAGCCLAPLPAARRRWLQCLCGSTQRCGPCP